MHDSLTVAFSAFLAVVLTLASIGAIALTAHSQPLEAAAYVELA